MPLGSAYTALVSTNLLYEHQQDPDWILFDCRFDLSNPGWGLRDYQKGHIPRAIYAHLNDELAGPVQNNTGRHPFPKPEHWVETLSNWGINPGKQVVLYDTTGGSFAARMWLMLRWIGLTRVAVLDGGMNAWVGESHPLAAGIEIGKPTWYYGRPDQAMLAKTGEVDRIRLDPQYVLIDARSPARYRGEEETIDSVAGHIPGAINHFYGENLTPDGKFLSPQALRERYTRLLNGLPPQNAVVYCGSGVTSCHVLLAMEAAGLGGSRLYPGSWSEWIRDPARPIAVGDAVSTGAV
jgi:thiosulfate/3-mercaptopyruvate sulfurtransferase